MFQITFEKESFRTYKSTPYNLCTEFIHSMMLAWNLAASSAQIKSQDTNNFVIALVEQKSYNAWYKKVW